MMCRFDRSEGSVYWLGGLLYESKGSADLGMLTTGPSGGPRGLTERCFHNAARQYMKALRLDISFIGFLSPVALVARNRQL